MASPLIDVASEVLTDPVFLDSFSVIRTPNAVNSDGRNSGTPVTISGLFGVFDAATPNDLLRLDDQDRMGRNMVLVTSYKLNGPSDDRNADKVIWNGDTYVVKHIDPYNRYGGGGFIQAIIGSIDAQDSDNG